MRDPYEVLGVPQGGERGGRSRAPSGKLAKKLHPDANKNDPKAAARFAELNAAYEILGDEDKRKAFDRGEIDAEGKPRFQGFEGFGGRPGAAPAASAARGAVRDLHLGPEGFQRARRPRRRRLRRLRGYSQGHVRRAAARRGTAAAAAASSRREDFAQPPGRTSPRPSPSR